MSARGDILATSSASTLPLSARAVPDEKVNILLVDDREERLLSYEAILGPLGENLVRASSGEEALRLLMEVEFAVILLDVNMPGMDGFETASLIHRHPRFERTPIIFVTAVNTTDMDRLQGYKLGAIDYVSVPIVPDFLRSKVGVLIELQRKRRELERLNKSLAGENALLMQANLELQTEKAAELERLNANLERANYELANANQSLHIEILERRRAEERTRFMAESIPSIIWTAAPDGTVTYANQRWLDFAESRNLGPNGEWPALVIDPEQSTEVRARWAEHLKRGEPYESEVRIRRRDGAWRWFLIRAVPWRVADGRIASWFGVCTDIDDQKGLEEQLREEDKRKDEFLATLAHELRNPLAPLQNSLHILNLSNGAPEHVAQARGVMERQLKQMVRLVDDLLDVSRITRGKLDLRRERTTLESVLTAAIEANRPLIESLKHDLVVDMPAADVELVADARRLAQVFGNLINNACKYTDSGGRVSIRARADGDTVAVTVKDSGVGFDAAVRDRIFDLFVQVDTSLERARGGLGIGLTLVRRLVHMHGGTVEGSSEGPGKGSEFTVRLPIQQLAEAPKPVEAPKPAESTAKKRILVVDDNRDAADTLAFSINVLGHEVRVAYDAEEVVELASRWRPQIVFMDVGMPKLNGFDVARLIRAEEWGRNMVLVAVTGWGKEDDRRRSQEAGFDHHLVKPADLADIERLCREPERRQAAAAT